MHLGDGFVSKVNLALVCALAALVLSAIALHRSVSHTPIRLPEYSKAPVVTSPDLTISMPSTTILRIGDIEPLAHSAPSGNESTNAFSQPITAPTYPVGSEVMNIGADLDVDDLYYNAPIDDHESINLGPELDAG